MENHLIRKLSAANELDEDDCRALEQLSKDSKLFEPKQEIIAQGERPDFLHLMIEGWAARYKSLPDGTRQIVGFLIPGDFCDLHVEILGAMDHSIVALGRKAAKQSPRLILNSLVAEGQSTGKAPRSGGGASSRL